MAARVKPEDATVGMPEEAEVMAPLTTSETSPLLGEERTAGVPRALNLMALNEQMIRTSRLDDDGQRYVDKLKKLIADANPNLVFKALSIAKVDALAIAEPTHKMAFLLIFEQSYTDYTGAPVASAIEDLVSVAKNSPDFENVVQAIVVTTGMYNRAPQMAAFIVNTLSLYTNNLMQFNVQALKNTKYTVITNIDSVRRFFKEFSPHDVPARDDIGILVAIEETKINQSGIREVVQTPIIGVTGYTRFLDPQNRTLTGVKYMPVVTITDMIFAIPKIDLLTLALPIAADAFVRQGLWQTPYKDLQKGKPNLGTLYVVGDKPAPCQTLEQLGLFISTYLSKPWLGVDIALGRAMPIGLASLLDEQGTRKLFARLAAFLGTEATVGDITSGSCPVYYSKFDNFTGIYTEKGEAKDTRCVDYLGLVAQGAAPRDAAPMLFQPNMPNVTIDNIKKLYSDGSVKSLYRTSTLTLSGHAVAWMIKSLEIAGIRPNYDIPQSGNINIDSLVNLANEGAQYGAFGGVATGFNNIGISNPFGNGFLA